LCLALAAQIPHLNNAYCRQRYRSQNPFATMAARQRVAKVMTQPIVQLFRFLQSVCTLRFFTQCQQHALSLPQKTQVQIWLYENTTTKLEGRIIVCVADTGSFCLQTHTQSQGFDEYMNVVLDNAEEIDTKKKSRVELGE
jgi:small nuclear ribonucleoprotein E